MQQYFEINEDCNLRENLTTKGYVISVGDGIVLASGLEDVLSSELIFVSKQKKTSMSNVKYFKKENQKKFSLTVSHSLKKKLYKQIKIFVKQSLLNGIVFFQLVLN